MSALLYLEHLNDADLTLLATTADESRDDLLAHLQVSPGYLEVLLKHPLLFARLFGGGEHEALLRASPFLVFAVLVHRAIRDLGQVRFVEEWVGPGKRVPMFEVEALRHFAADGMRRLFLAELLASYTHVSSGTMWIQTARGWRRRRFSELDPLRLVELLDIVPEAERPAVYRRLGDLALFLTGVFPDYASSRLLAPINRQRLQRALRSEEEAPGSADSIWLLEMLGHRSYRLAGKAAEGVDGSMSTVLADLAQGFGHARRILNFLTDRYLYPFRNDWFPLTNA